MPRLQNLPDCLTTVFNCTSLQPSCHNRERFEFVSLWNITLRYASQCPTGPLLFRNNGVTGTISANNLALTNEACEAIAGATWRKYAGDAIWSRLTTWKFPLFQLVANSPRPPLGFWVESFAFVHFLGDPIGTISDLLRKIDSCQSRAIFWQNHLDNELSLLWTKQSERKHYWKALAVIVDSFDEWGQDAGDLTQAYLLDQLKSLCAPKSDPVARQKFISVCTLTADALAADRSTKSVPVVIAQAFFIASIAIALIRTKSSSLGSNPTSYIQIEVYSIAFTAQYFWVIFAVCWTSIVGVSQTAAAIPRILRRFVKDLRIELQPYGIEPNLPIHLLEDDDRRVYSGGIYTWQPGRKWSPAARNSSYERHGIQRGSGPLHYCFSRLLSIWPVIYLFLPITIVGTAAATGQILSALVPPVGWSSRSVAMMWMFIAWIISYLCSLTFCLFGDRLRARFWITFAKDFLAIGVTFGIIIETQFGIYNRCNAYTRWGKTGLQLPFMPAVNDVLRHRIASTYPLATTIGIAIQLIVFPVLLIWRYHAAFLVFLQRDDAVSNFEWWYTLARRFRRRDQKAEATIETTEA